MSSTPYSKCKNDTRSSFKLMLKKTFLKVFIRVRIPKGFHLVSILPKARFSKSKGLTCFLN